MPSFLHPNLLWTLGLPTLGVVALPVLIHLINMMRHRQVDWAAMEFLLTSQKKNRTWVMLKQLLLLLLRMAVLAAIVLLVAQPVLQNQWSGLLGTGRTHHIVLLDDSFSMSDRWEDTNAFAEAKKVVQRIAAEAARQIHPQRFTLLRFSRVGRLEQAAEPDYLKQSVGPNFADQLSALLAKCTVTQTAAVPTPSLQAIEQLLGQGDGERRIVYLVSDFRIRQWSEPTELRKALQRLSRAGAELHLIDCVDHARPNLAITSLTPSDGIRAAGVPWFMEVAVQNFGTSTARNVAVVLGEDGHGRPSAALPEIPPGRSAKERFLVNFPDAGPHEITAKLESDAVEIDNHRYCAIHLPTDVAALLIDGDPEAKDAKYLSLAMAPGGSVRTGIRPQIETPRYLAAKPLDGFATINLLNIERLDAAAIDALEKYVASGGGLAFFLGERCLPKYFNDALYRNGLGLFPVPLARHASLVVDRLDPAPDIQAEPHFIFRVFGATRNTFLQTVGVERYAAMPENWHPPADRAVRIAAKLRNGAPLVVERNFGKGRVMAFLSTAAPTWNNWAVNPSFVVVVQDLQAYLAKRTGEPTRLVAAPLELPLDPATYQPQVRFNTPQSGNAGSTVVRATSAADGTFRAVLSTTDWAGFYEAQLQKTNGSLETRHFALNVDPTEGDLSIADSRQVAAGLEGVHYKFDRAAAFQMSAAEIAGNNLAETILYIVVLLLVLEQLIARSAGYHPTRIAAGQGRGA